MLQGERVREDDMLADGVVLAVAKIVAECCNKR